MILTMVAIMVYYNLVKYVELTKTLVRHDLKNMPALRKGNR